MSHIFYWGRGIFTLHHGRSRVASFRFTCPHLQVDFHSESSPVDSPADIFIHSSFLFLFFPERGNRNAFYPRCPPRNSVRRWQKKNKKNRRSLEQSVTFCPPPLAAENYEQWAALTFLHSQVRRRLRSRPGPMAHREALSYLSPAGQWRAAPRLTWRLSVRSLSSQRSIPASAGITEDLTPAGSDVRCPRQNLTRRYLLPTLSPSDEADRPVDENDAAPPERNRLFFFRLQTSGETQGRDNNAQKLLKRIVSRRRYAYFFLLFIAYLLLQFQKVVEIFIVYICTRLQF